jgi:hypothetical protein
MVVPIIMGVSATIFRFISGSAGKSSPGFAMICWQVYFSGIFGIYR